MKKKEIMNRLKEPSTWAGIAALAQVLAGMLPAGSDWATAAHAITAAAGAAAVKLREGTP